MKRLAWLCPLIFAVAPLSHAARLQVLIPNFDSYGTGMVCVVDQEYNARFSDLMRAPDFDTDPTNRQTALKLMTFFRDVDQDACYKLVGTSAHITLADAKTVYVATIIYEAQTASRVYWKVVTLDASSGAAQSMTVDAPAAK